MPAKYKYTKTFSFQGQRIFIRANTKKELEEKYIARRKELEEAHANGRYKKSCELTLDEFFPKWIDSRRGTVKPSTLNTQINQFAVISKSPIDKTGRTFGSLKLDEIEVQNVRDLQRFLLTDAREYFHPEITDKKKTYTTTYVNVVISQLSQILSDAVRDQIIKYNPASNVRNAKRKESEKEARHTIHRALTSEEIKLFFDNASDSWYKNHYLFLINSGLRLGELGALTRADIDYEKRVIHIRKTIRRQEDGSHTIGKSAKTRRGNRDIPLTKTLEDIIRDQLAINKAQFGDGKVTPIDGSTNISQVIFKNSRNSIIEISVIDVELRKRCNQIGIEPFTAHAFRDTFATRAIEAGMQPNTLKEILGHSSLSMTMDLYCHVLEDTKVNEMDLIEKIG